MMSQSLWGVIAIGWENGFFVFRIGSGTYRFETRQNVLTGSRAGHIECGRQAGVAL